ncbi:MAG: LysR family transcriptional regulator [Rhizobiaceae bacterium]|nr:LysR family transcriptional regulator [Rhizobiaceae bacterium]
MTHTPEVLALDFAALRTFQLVYKHKSFAAAAKELGMNPSSVSYTIDRVRKAANDVLFVKQGGSIAVTDRCRVIMETTERILAEAERLPSDEAFDPTNAEEEISIVCTVYAREILIPKVVRRLRIEAPGIRIRLTYSPEEARELLLDGTCNLGLINGLISESGILCHEWLLVDRHLCMMDPKNQAAQKTCLVAEDFDGASYVSYEPYPGWVQSPFRHILANGIKPRKVLATSDSRDLGLAVKGTDLFAVLPARMALAWEDSLALSEFDFDTPAGTHMYWTAATHHSKISKWLRNIFVEEAQGLPVPSITS